MQPVLVLLFKGIVGSFPTSLFSPLPPHFLEEKPKTHNYRACPGPHDLGRVSYGNLSLRAPAPGTSPLHHRCFLLCFCFLNVVDVCWARPHPCIVYGSLAQDTARLALAQSLPRSLTCCDFGRDLGRVLNVSVFSSVEWLP